MRLAPFLEGPRYSKSGGGQPAHIVGGLERGGFIRVPMAIRSAMAFPFSCLVTCMSPGPPNFDSGRTLNAIDPTSRGLLMHPPSGTKRRRPDRETSEVVVAAARIILRGLMRRCCVALILVQPSPAATSSLEIGRHIADQVVAGQSATR